MVARKFLKHIGMPGSAKGVKLETLITNGLKHIYAPNKNLCKRHDCLCVTTATILPACPCTYKKYI